MSTPEFKVKQFITKRMKEHFPNAFKYCPIGGRWGKSGLPDFIYLIQGIFVGIEAKAEGNKATPLQISILQKLSEQGAIVAIVTGKDESKINKIIEAVNNRRIREINSFESR
jgi:hypothetical protein